MSLIFKTKMLEISNSLNLIVMTNIAHCVIKSENMVNINLLIYALCIDLKIAQIVPESVFLVKKQCFWPKIRTKYPYHLSNMVSFERELIKV